MGRARAMLIQAGLEAKYKEEFWCEVISIATKLDNIMVRPERKKPHDPLYPQRHLNHTSPLPTSRRGLRGMQVPIPSSRMKGTTTPSFATSKQLPRHKD